MFINKNEIENNQIKDMTCNHQCSRCGSCCGLFIPFTEKELNTLKEYVKSHNIKPINRINALTGQLKAHCCFYDEINQKCIVYEARPYACRDFKCDRKDWKSKRDMYEKRAKYNSSLTSKIIMGTFNDLIFNEYEPIIRYLLSLLPISNDGIDDKLVVSLFKQVNRLDLLNHFVAYDKNGNKINGNELLHLSK